MRVVKFCTGVTHDLGLHEVLANPVIFEVYPDGSGRWFAIIQGYSARNDLDLSGVVYLPLEGPTKIFQVSLVREISEDVAQRWVKAVTSEVGSKSGLALHDIAVKEAVRNFAVKRKWEWHKVKILDISPQVREGTKFFRYVYIEYLGKSGFDILMVWTINPNIGVPNIGYLRDLHAQLIVAKLLTVQVYKRGVDEEEKSKHLKLVNQTAKEQKR